MPDLGTLELFVETAAKAGSKVLRAKNMLGAIQIAVELCQGQAPCEKLLPEESAVPGKAGNFADSQTAKKIIAAPGLEDKDFKQLAELATQAGLSAVNHDLRSYLTGFELALIRGSLGIAETASAVVDCTAEDIRLASMLAESCVLVLLESEIVKSLYAAEPLINHLQSAGPRFISLISGASRTADIERVLTLGVHGPLGLYFILLSEW